MMMMMSPHRDLVYAPSHVSNKINRLRNIVRNVNLDWHVQQFARVSLVPRSVVEQHLGEEFEYEGTRRETK